MRKLKAKTKEQVRVVIPEDLKAFMDEVYSLIQRGDESTEVESDDLLQSEAGYGGLLEVGRQDYRFTYFPNHKSRGVRDTWELQFSAWEIEAIAKGQLREITLWACQDKSCDCKFQDPNDTCFYCDYEEA